MYRFKDNVVSLLICFVLLGTLGVPPPIGALGGDTTWWCEWLESGLLCLCALSPVVAPVPQKTGSYKRSFTKPGLSCRGEV